MTASQSEWPLYIQEAHRLGHDYIGCEHLLLGMLANEDGAARKMLATHGVTLEAARRKTDELIDASPGDSTHRSYTPRANVVLELANVEAERLGQLEPSEAHVLLALITEGKSFPIHLFSEFGVDVGKMREDLLEALEVPNDLREVYLRQRAAYEQAERRRLQEFKALHWPEGLE